MVIIRNDIHHKPQRSCTVVCHKIFLLKLYNLQTVLIKIHSIQIIKQLNVIEQTYFNLCIPQETTLKPDANGYYDIWVNSFDPQGNPITYKAHFRMINGQPMK